MSSAHSVDTDAERRSTMFARTDYWRGSPARHGGRAGHKEWSYFCVFAPELELLVNFSLMDTDATGRGRELEVARLAAMTCEGGDGWEGDVDQYATAEFKATAGTAAAQFGASSVGFADGLYRLNVRLRNRPLSAALQFRPLVKPAIASSVRLSDHGAMRWLVVPRLLATGTVDIADRHYVLEDCLAYHDRNWGYFGWGGDFAWEWATILPDDAAEPWSIVYMRISDRFRNRTFSQGLIVWRGDTAWRTFHGHDVGVRQSALQRHASVFRVPRIMRLAAPGTAADVPQHLNVKAVAGNDALDVGLDFHNLAQLAIPNDGATGITLLSESAGRARVSGRIRGQDIDFSGRVLAEFNHGT